MSQPQRPTDPEPKRPKPLHVPERDVSEAESVFFLDFMCRITSPPRESYGKEDAWFSWTPDHGSLVIRSKLTGEEASVPRGFCVVYYAPTLNWKADREFHAQAMDAYEREYREWLERQKQAHATA